MVEDFLKIDTLLELLNCTFNRQSIEIRSFRSIHDFLNALLAHKLPQTGWIMRQSPSLVNCTLQKFHLLYASFPSFFSTFISRLCKWFLPFFRIVGHLLLVSRRFRNWRFPSDIIILFALMAFIGYLVLFCCFNLLINWRLCLIKSFTTFGLMLQYHGLIVDYFVARKTLILKVGIFARLAHRNVAIQTLESCAFFINFFSL